MYPFGGDQAYPRNRWYIAAFSHELSQTPIERRLLDVPVALYRTSEGRPVAMYGLCPHRYFPLALGKVEGDALVCGYHGFTFASSGKCVRIPSSGAGAGFVQPTYPLEERGFLLWIWMGDRALADPALIPPYEDFGLDQPGWVTSGGERLELKARSQLLVDNLMDLTHLPFIHHQIPGGQDLLRTQDKFSERERSLRLTQVMQHAWTPWHSALYGEENQVAGPVESHGVTDFYGPELIRTSGPMVPRPAADGQTAYLGEVYFLHGITPETATSTHYWSLQTRNVRIEDDAFSDELAGVDRFVRSQDISAIEAVEARVEQAAAAQRELLARSDRAAMMVRDRIRAMLAAESAPSSGAPEAAAVGASESPNGRAPIAAG